MAYLLLVVLTLAPLFPAQSNIATQHPWFAAQRDLDLTGDHRLDVVRIRADGPSSDSLLVTLTFLVDGTERWREQWNSDYMLIDPPNFPNGERDRAAYVRRGLRRALASVEVEPFDSTQYVLMADPVDSAIIRQPPRLEIALSYGYETTLILQWNAGRKAFIVLWGCC
jgi:hypothetical protein